jgi:hypothetical protein
MTSKVDMVALAGESSSDLTYDTITKEYRLSHDDLVNYAKIIAFKVSNAAQNGHTLDETENPLT